MNKGTARMARLLISVGIFPLLFAIAACNLQIGNKGVLEGTGPDILTPEGAREKIAVLGIPYTIDEFVGCARESDVVAVKLFLTAGMNPNAKDKDGVTALAAASEAGHNDVMAVLKEATAK
jgi:ankyrin repeat protein